MSAVLVVVHTPAGTFSGLDCGAFWEFRVSIHCTNFLHFSCVFGVIESANVALQFVVVVVYPFRPLPPPTSQSFPTTCISYSICITGQVASKFDYLGRRQAVFKMKLQHCMRSISLAIAPHHLYSDFIVLMVSCAP